MKEIIGRGHPFIAQPPLYNTGAGATAVLLADSILAKRKLDRVL